MNLLGFSLIVMALAQALDLATFALMIERHGPRAEANPFVAALVADHGVLVTALAKGALVVLVAATAILLSARGEPRSHRRIAAGIVASAIVFGIVGGWTNVLTFLRF